MASKSPACAVLFSGGTDSTCAADLCAAEFAEVHLLTFTQAGTRGDPIPSRNAERLARARPDVKFIHVQADVEDLVRYFAGTGYLKDLFRHGFFVLSNPGHSSLAWHTATAAYCLGKGIKAIADGLTRELMHFPGHMDFFVARARELHASLGITYTNPVRNWSTPPDRQFTDRLLVNRHGYFPFLGVDGVKTTGEHLYRRGILPAPDVKGSAFDRGMQHSCYPFMLFNIFAFWFQLNLTGEDGYERGMAGYFEGRFALAERLLRRASDGSLPAATVDFRELNVYNG